MKRILISVVLALALAGTTAFAAQNKNAGGKTKPAASKPAATGNMAATKGKGKHHRRHHRKGGSKTSNSNSGGMSKTKSKNSK